MTGSGLAAHRRSWLVDGIYRLSLAAIPLLLVAGGALFLTDFLLSTQREWNDVRLAPSAGLLRGYAIYDDAPDGPLLGNAYGPIYPLVFLLPALLPTPSLVIFSAVLVNFLFFMLPALILIHLQSHGQRMLALSASLFFWQYTFKTPVLVGPAFWVHADGPALGLAALSAALLYSKGSPPSGRRMAAAALAVVLAVGCKQPVVTSTVAAAVYLGITVGWRTARRYLAYVAGIAAAVVVVLSVSLVDFGSMIFNAIVVPIRHPLLAEGQTRVAAADFGGRVIVPVVMIGVAVALDLGLNRHRTRSWRTVAIENRWWLLLAIGIVGIPLSIMSRAKTGGAWNTMAPALYFLVIAGVLGIMHNARALGSRLGIDGARLGTAAFLAAGLILAGANLSRASKLPEALAQVGEDLEDTAFAFARAHPGQVYFPFNPLVTLMSEGRAYHFSWGIRAYELADEQVDDEYFWRHMPADLRYVVTDSRRYRASDRERIYSLRYLQEFSETLAVSELPGWTVLVRP